MKYKYGFESIFDHDPTPEELDLFGINSEEDVAYYAELIKKHGESNYVSLACLFHHRGNAEKTQEYLDKIDDPQLRFDTEYGFQD